MSNHIVLENGHNTKNITIDDNYIDLKMHTKNKHKSHLFQSMINNIII